MILRPRFLVLRGGAIGDFVLTLPVLQALRAQWPEAHIEVVGYPHIAELARAGGWADRVESLDRAHFARFYSWRPALGDALIQYVRSFDLVVSFLHDPDGVVRRNLESTGVRQVLYRSPVDPRIHATDHLLKVLETLAIYAAGAAPRLSLPPEAVAAGRRRLAGAGAAPDFALAIHPGSGSPKKNWPAERFGDLARRARADGFSPFFVFGEADEATAERLRACAPDVPRIESLELMETAAALAAARAFVGNDSGIAHLAAALGLASIVLFGPTDPDIWGPRGAAVTILRAPEGALDRLGADAVWRALSEAVKPGPPPPASPAPPPDSP